MNPVLPPSREIPRVAAKTAILLASGDSRLSANSLCWPTQKEVESQARQAFEACGWSLERGSPERWSDEEPHGFVFSQAHGREVFASIDPDAPLVMVEAVWQYSMHVVPGLVRHRGPILILANWSGTWPGLVGALNLRGSLTKAGREHSLLWGEDFASKEFRDKLSQWLNEGKIDHDLSHVAALNPNALSEEAQKIGKALAADLQRRPAIMGVFDEGCMGMFNAIVPDHLLHPTGVFKERLSQSTLVAHMKKVSDQEAREAYQWILDQGMSFAFGEGDDPLLEEHVLEQCRMYIAAVRLADRFGCDTIGIQYQLGLTETTVASDLAEGLLNCTERPPVRAIDGPRAGEVLYPQKPLPHFNEVDECAGLDALITQRVWDSLGMRSDNTLHDVRWSDRDESSTVEDEVFVFEISGAVPPSHFEQGYASATGHRQPAMYFAPGGSSVCGMSRPGVVVWSRVYVDGFAHDGRGDLVMDLGLLDAVALPDAEMRRRWESTTPQWPIMNAILRGVSRDQLMAKHQSNHIQVVYAEDEASARRALAAKAAMAHEMGLRVHLCGVSLEG